MNACASHACYKNDSPPTPHPSLQNNLCIVFSLDVFFESLPKFCPLFHPLCWFWCETVGSQHFSEGAARHLSWQSIRLKCQMQYWCRFDSQVQQGSFLPESAFCADSLEVLHSPHTQAHASTPACTFKIPNTGSHTIGHMKILHAEAGMDSAALAAAVALSRWGDPHFWH